MTWPISDSQLSSRSGCQLYLILYDPTVRLPQYSRVLNLDKNTDNFEAVATNCGKVSGAWVFRGTRVPVAALFENLLGGATLDQFLKLFPGVGREDVEAALNYEVPQLTRSDAA